MSLIPTWPIAVGTLVFGLAVGAGGMHVWDAKEIASLNIDIAKLKQSQAEAVSTASQAALADLTAAAANIKAASETGSAQVSALGVKLDTINRNLKNAKPTPLPVDCRPGADRVRNLSESAAAVDQAIVGSVPRK